jgi:DNA-directed RNA polymerase subunit M/transcription elongation factor TFIIS
MTTQILNNYKLLLKQKINEKNINTQYSEDNIIDYLYKNNNMATFTHKMYDILCALDLTEDTYILELLNDLNKLNKATTYEMCPDINKSVHDEIKTRTNAEYNSLKYYNTDFTCKKCKHNKTTIIFVNKHISSDEASSMKITCVNCNNDWYT